MCTPNEKSAIHNFNRILIGLTGITSMLVDGFTGGDALCIVSLVAWLLQPECSILEECLLDRLKAKAAQTA